MPPLRPSLLQASISSLAALLLVPAWAAQAAPSPAFPSPAFPSLRPLPAAVAGNTLKLLESRLHRHRDHLERSAQRLTLPEALATGLERNPRLASAFAQIETTRWDGVAIRREWFPSLIAGNESPGAIGLQQQQGDSSTLISPQLNLAWTFFDPSRAPRRRANAAGLAAERFLFDVEARSLVLDIQSQYFDLQTLITLERDYADMSALVAYWSQQARDQARRGPATPDLDQLASQEQALLILRIDTHEQVIVAASRLAESLSLPPGEIVMPAQHLTLQGDWSLDRLATIQQALRLREEIQQNLAKAQQLSWTAVATRRRYLPELAVEASGYVQAENGNSTISSEAEAGVTLNWTLFDGGILSASAAAQGQQQQQALQQAALQRLSVTAQVETSYAAYINSQIVTDSAIAQLTSARQSITAASDSYAAGRADATTLLQVLGSYRSAVESYSRSLQKHNKAVAELQRYSSQWPESALPLVQRRLQELGRPHIRSSVGIPSSPRPSLSVSALSRQSARREERAGPSARSTGTWS